MRSNQPILLVSFVLVSCSTLSAERTVDHEIVSAEVGAETTERHVVRAREPATTDDEAVARLIRVVVIEDEGDNGEEPATCDERFATPMDDFEMSSPFGMRQDPLSPSRRRMHRGIDLAAPTGTPVFATASGTALMAGYCDRGTGNCIVLEHGCGWRSQYFHLDEVHIRVNSWVEQGAHIGDVGSTGRSTGPHLHFQIGRDGQDFDPMTLVGQTLMAE